MKRSEAYTILNIEPTDDENIIKKAYRKMAKKYHPDALAAKGLDTPENLERMSEINEAYNVLMTEDESQIETSSIFDGDDMFDDLYDDDSLTAFSDDLFTQEFDVSNSINSTYEVLNLTKQEALLGTQKTFSINKNGNYIRLQVEVDPCTLDGETKVVKDGDEKYIIIFKVA